MRHMRRRKPFDKRKHPENHWFSGCFLLLRRHAPYLTREERPYSAKQRYRKATICARVQGSFGLKVAAVVPLVIFCS